MKYFGVPPMPSEAYTHRRIVLASNSPRRRELLGMVVPAFETAPSRDIDETYPASLAPEKVPEYLSQLKARAYDDLLSEDVLLITADTIVLLESRILGKPHTEKEAVEMLMALSGRTHTVVTGVTLSSASGKKSDTFSVKTQVRFGALEQSEVEEYVRRFRPLDKAGAYGIQEWIGAAAIEGIEGSFYNVMGLPLNALYCHLKDFFS